MRNSGLFTANHDTHIQRSVISRDAVAITSIAPPCISSRRRNQPKILRQHSLPVVQSTSWKDDNIVPSHFLTQVRELGFGREELLEEYQK